MGHLMCVKRECRKGREVHWREKMVDLERIKKKKKKRDSFVFKRHLAFHSTRVIIINEVVVVGQ